MVIVAEICDIMGAAVMSRAMVRDMSLPPAIPDQTAVEVDSLDFCYGSKQSLFNVNMLIPKNRVTAFIGPSGCGKSTLLRCINRMNDRIPEARVTRGAIRIDGVDVTSPTLDPIRLRREVGMVFQKSNPFPMSIYENVSYGLKLAGVKNRAVLDEAVEESLNHAALWDEVKDRLHTPANGRRPAAAPLHRPLHRRQAAYFADG